MLFHNLNSVLFTGKSLSHNFKIIPVIKFDYAHMYIIIYCYFQKSAYVHLLRNCNTKEIDTVFDLWLWWLFSYLPSHYLVRYIHCTCISPKT